MPEVSLVAILDADKEGFLRSDTAMIQTIGRAARNEHGRVIMYADRVTESMDRAIGETERRRAIQEAYNEEHGIIPKTIHKDVRDLIELTKIEDDVDGHSTTSGTLSADDADAVDAGGIPKTGKGHKASPKGVSGTSLSSKSNSAKPAKEVTGAKQAPKDVTYSIVSSGALAVADISVEDLYNLIEKTDRDMKAAAKVLDFEKAAMLRDQLGELRQQWSDMHAATDSKITKPKKTRRKRTET